MNAVRDRSERWRMVGSGAFVGPVAAVGPASGDGMLGAAIIAGLALSAGLLVAWVAVTQRLDGEGRVADWLAVAVGPLLASLGAATMLTAAGANPGLAGVAAAVGSLLAWAVVSTPRDGRGVAFVRRGVGGATLAAGYAAGSVVGLLGAVLLTGHVTLEAALDREVGRLRAALAAVAVQGGVLGVGVLALESGGIPPGGRVAALAFAGGSLLVIGVAETTLSGSTAGGRRVGAS